MTAKSSTMFLGLVVIVLEVAVLHAQDPNAAPVKDASTPAAAPTSQASPAGPAAAAAPLVEAATPAAPAAAPAPVAAPAVQAPAVQAPAEPLRLMSAEKDARLRKYFPDVEDAKLRAILKDPHLILYTEEEMPKAYQFWDGAFPGVHATSYNISANGGEPHGNGNVEFPWGAPAGLHRASGTFSFRFMWLPRDANGKLLPIVYHAHENGGYAWTYPVGTLFGEILGLQDRQGLGYTFEMRVRRREEGDWAVDAFRPFPEAKDLAKRIKELAPQWQGQAQTAQLVTHLETPLELPEQFVGDTQPGRPVFRQKMGVDTLPAVGDDKLTSKLLLTTQFKSAQGKVWRASASRLNYTAAPTTQASFHVVPQNYEAGFVDVDQASCARCHDSTNVAVDQFDSGRDWYGRVRGSDGIFSFHPFEPGAISNNGYSSSGSFRDRLVSGGVFQRFNQLLHPRTHYSSLRTR